MNPLVIAYDFHKQRFALQENRFLRLFEALLSTAPCSMLECSITIAPQGTHAGRIRLGYEQQYIQDGLRKIDDFLREIEQCKSVHLNRSILAQIINNDFDASKVIAIGVGLDYKKDMNDSKVKYYLLLKEYPLKTNQILSLHPPLDNIRDYLVHEEFGVGISLYFDGRTSLEIYLSFGRQYLNNGDLMDRLRLRDAVRLFIEESNLLHISFEEDGRRLFHFNPKHPTQFVHFLNNRSLSLVYSDVQILNYILSQLYHLNPLSVALCLAEDEVMANNIENISLYYALTSRDWETNKDSSLT
jgi:LynF/TruF/PatF family peptide O-prenyltransferase